MTDNIGAKRGVGVRVAKEMCTGGKQAIAFGRNIETGKTDPGEPSVHL